jgi:orotidine-5'-phosphate decarboxylase
VVNKEKIIVALDVPGPVQAREIIAQLRNEVGGFKIGLQLFTAAGTAFVKELVKTRIKLFLDLKYHDIPNTVAKASVEAARLGIWMFNVHTLGGSNMMLRAVDELREVCDKENLTLPKIIGVTVLTSSDSDTLQEVGIKANTSAQVLHLARLASNCGLDGVVASPQEVKMIRSEIENKRFLIVTPGIRPVMKPQNQKTDFPDDQSRSMAPSEAVYSGSDYLVIGRPILNARNKILAVREILESINDAPESQNESKVLEFTSENIKLEGSTRKK